MVALQNWKKIYEISYLYFFAIIIVTYYFFK
nr:MAG TPA: hypothetical protein [Caudoviricetes sp.]